MAIFKKNKKTEVLVDGEKEIKKDSLKKSTKEEKPSSGTSNTVKASHSFLTRSGEMEHVLKRPHITEKASIHAENGVYVFQVDKRANKSLVSTAIKELYKVSPVKVNIVNLPAKKTSSKGVKGMKTGKKKALVYLKKGDTIEII